MHLKAWWAGTVAGVLDVALIAVADPSASGWVWAQSFIAWAITGFAAVMVPTRWGPRASALGVTLALNLPWFIALGPGAGHWEHVPGLVVMSAVFGLGFAWVRGRARSGGDVGSLCSSR